MPSDEVESRLHWSPISLLGGSNNEHRMRCYTPIRMNEDPALWLGPLITY